MATIDTPGPFSVLPDARRCLLLASDTALHLSIDGVVHCLGYTDHVGFDGGAAVEVVAISAACRALNLMTYGDVVGSLHVDRGARDADLSDRDAAALVVLDGSLHIAEEVLGRYDTLVLGRERVHVRCEAATVVRVSLGEALPDLPPHRQPSAGGGPHHRAGRRLPRPPAEPSPPAG